jgi:hypothetical protein
VGLLRELPARAGLPATPVPHYVPSAVVNAFATGSAGGMIALTVACCAAWAASWRLLWSTKTGHRVKFSSIGFLIRLVVTHHYIRAVLVRCNIQRYSPLLRELHGNT